MKKIICGNCKGNKRIPPPKGYTYLWASGTYGNSVWIPKEKGSPCFACDEKGFVMIPYKNRIIEFLSKLLGL